MKTNTIKAIGLAFLLLASTAAYAESTAYGASGAIAAIESGRALSITEMLRFAADDEYLARAEYVAIMARFGAIRPYTNIKASEDQHLEWLKAEYAARGLRFPADTSAGHLVVPVSLEAAARTGVEAERANIAMYEAFLRSPAMADPANASVRALYDQLRRASENHLQAFQTQLSKY